jgi:hypothetical protein
MHHEPRLVACEPIRTARDHVSGIGGCSPLEGALPHDSDPPAKDIQSGQGHSITPPVALDFLAPEFDAGTGPSEQVAVMAVPEAAMHEQNRAMLWQNHVWPAGKPAIMKAIAETAPVQS